MKRKILLFLTFVFVAGIALLAFLGFRYTDGLQAVGGDGEPQVIAVESGDSAATIGNKLEAAGLLRSRQSYDIYVKLSGAGSDLRKGSYIFSPRDSVEVMVDAMTTGKIATKKVTIPPGLRLDQIADRLVIQEGYDRAAIEQAFASAESKIAFDRNGSSLRLEGLVFPETYTIGYNEGAEEVIKQAVLSLENAITQELIDGFEAKGLAVQDAVILASIVQEEASDPVEQRRIAGVFLNRLDIGMQLGADPTFRYASYLEGLENDKIDIVNPYNTRLYAGLPPGPIANFNLSALEAVANPEESSNLFFVAGDDGVIHYNETFEQHTKDAEEFCIELCQL